MGRRQNSGRRQKVGARSSSRQGLPCGTLVALRTGRSTSVRWPRVFSLHTMSFSCVRNHNRIFAHISWSDKVLDSTLGSLKSVLPQLTQPSSRLMIEGTYSTSLVPFRLLEGHYWFGGATQSEKDQVAKQTWSSPGGLAAFETWGATRRPRARAVLGKVQVLVERPSVSQAQ
jgi:hypothetical protein